MPSPGSPGIRELGQLRGGPRVPQCAEEASNFWRYLQPLLVKAGYGPHGAASWILAEARALRARQEATRGTDHTRDCRVCAEGRRMDAARARGDVAAYREIAR